MVAVFITFSAFALGNTTLPSLVTTIAKDMQFKHESFGYIFLLQYLCFAAASYIGGCVRRRFGIADRRLLMVGLFSLAALFTAAIGVTGLYSVLLWIILLGLASGTTETFAAVLVAKLDAPASSKLQNLAQVFFCFGAIASPYVIGLLLGAQVPWRYIFLIFSGFIFLSATFFTATTGHLTPIQRPAPAVAPAAAPRLDPAFILIATGMFLYVVVEIGAAMWLATYFEYTFELSAADAAWRPGLLWTGIIVGRALVVVLPRRWSVWPPAIIGPAGMVLGAVLIACSPTPLLASGGILLYGLVAGPLWPVIVTISHNHGRSTRFTTGIIAFGAIGAGVGPLIASWVINYDLSLLFPALAVGSGLFLIAMIAAKNNLTRQHLT